MPSERSRTVTAARGPELRCRGWRQETILRMLENTLENAESPEELIVYAGSAQAARDWTSYERIGAALTSMDEDQTLVVQSGKPVSVFRTSVEAPMVVMANGALLGPARVDWQTDPAAAWATVRHLQKQGLTVQPGMTAAAWQYIGSQGILQGTYETFAAAARDTFAGSLAGRFIVTAGMGGMGGAQPLAGYLAGAVTLVADVDAHRIERRRAEGYVQHRCDSIDEALALCLDAARARRAVSVAVVANIVDLLQVLLERHITPDIVTDQTTVDFVNGYVPVGMTPDEVAAHRARGETELLVRRGKETIALHLRGMLELGRRGAQIFEYGNLLRSQASIAGVEDAFEMPSFIELFIRPLFCQGLGPFRWLATSGAPGDIDVVDELILRHFRGHPVADWITKARDHVRFTGLPARIGWMGLGDRAKLGALVNRAVAEGRISAPIAFTRDHLDSGSVASPYRETENMLDGSDGVADWPLLNGMLNAAAHADLVALHGYGHSAGVTVIADGSTRASVALERVLTNDPGLGVLRHAEAGYSQARETARRHALNLRHVEPPEPSDLTRKEHARAWSPSTGRCKGRRQEAILRLLENSIDLNDQWAGGDDGQEGTVVRTKADLDTIVNALSQIADDETLVVQSGRPIGVFHTHERSPMVVIANGNAVGRWASEDGHREMLANGLSIVPGLTAGAWQSSGTRAMHSAYTAFWTLAKRRWNGSLVGRLVVTGASTARGTAPPLAATFAGAAVLVVEPGRNRHGQDTADGHLTQHRAPIDVAIPALLDAKDAGRATAVGVDACMPDVLGALLDRGIVPDVITDEPHDGPNGRPLHEPGVLQGQVDALIELRRKGTQMVEVPGGLIAQAVAEGLTLPPEFGSIEECLRPLSHDGLTQLTWIATSARTEDLTEINMLARRCLRNKPTQDWMEQSAGRLPSIGLPSGAGLAGLDERVQLIRLVNDAVRSERVHGPVAFTSGHGYDGCAVAPLFTTRNMADGSDSIADWPLAEALLNVASGADLVAVQMHDGGAAATCGVTLIADGSRQCYERLERAAENDATLGLLRHADAAVDHVSRMETR